MADTTRTADYTNPGDRELLRKAERENLPLGIDRLKAMMPQCGFGELGSCCVLCYLGPCRIDPFDNGPKLGVCGANADVIVARNFLRAAVGGASSHAGHARELALLLLEVAEGKAPGYRVRDEAKLLSVAGRLGIPTEGRPVPSVAGDVARKAIEDFGRQDGRPMNWIRGRSSQKEYDKWEKLGLLVSNPHNEIETAMHRTSMGNDADPLNLWVATLRMGMVDNFAGLMLATDLSDILFGTPSPKVVSANYAVIRAGSVNLACHGHNPILASKLVEWADKMEAEAKEAGADGINVVGVCCIGNELAMRSGAAYAGHLAQAELFLATGAIDAMVVDMQCIWPGLTTIAKCYKTRFITTVPFVRNPDAIHIEFRTENADERAREILSHAIAGFRERTAAGQAVHIPQASSKMLTGISVEALVSVLSAANAADPLAPVVDAIASGDILGAVGIVGCPNPKLRPSSMTERMAAELLRHNVLIVTTGCVNHILAQAGFLTPEATETYAGESLRKVLTALGKAAGLGAPLPPVLHMGSCVDNSRIYDLLAALAGKIGIEVSQLPVAGSAPEFITEKAISIGSFFLAAGILVHVAPAPRVFGSPFAIDLLTRKLPEINGGKALVETDPAKAAAGIIAHLREKRRALGLA
ncbi:MAG TPA: anaerobic carbon-monoxide dehydrogenase catalytic subunit [Candidatus Deferrimicrobiaceae bacterium]|nr:anaerobic carbon-monoxide dehydrogenase catalytic subunit [Candidatus Deferrimicrobiaceae bacterium]